ncbi:MAG: phosphotransferase [Pseudomonadota bacterium]
MAEAIPGADDPRLTRALTTWRHWRAVPPEMPRVETRLPSFSNDVYCVRANSHRYVIRLNRIPTPAGVDRKLERKILATLGATNFLPPLVYADDACLITEFVAGQPLTLTDPNLVAMGNLFCRIHSTTANIAVKLDINNHIQKYAQALGSRNKSLNNCIRRLTIPGHSPARLTLCHHDLLPANVIRTDSGLVALDWEYARLGDPAFDLAVLVENENLSNGQTDLLLQAYGDASPAFRQQLELMRPRYALVSLLWWLLRNGEQPLSDTPVHTLATRLGITL